MSAQESVKKTSKHKYGSTNSTLPDKIDTAKVVEMIKNADLYDLINISLKQNGVKNEQVEQFI